MKKIVLVLVLFLILSGCSRKIDIMDNPSHIFSDEFKPANISLNGIKLGDSENKIDKNLVTSETESVGWVHVGQEYSYRIVENKVVEFALKENFIKKTGILREDEIYIRFGKPDKIEEAYKSLPGAGKAYYYINKGLIIRTSGADISQINILSK